MPKLLTRRWVAALWCNSHLLYTYVTADMQCLQVKTALLDSPRSQRAIPFTRCWKYNWNVPDGPRRVAFGPPDDYPAARAGNQLLTGGALQRLQAALAVAVLQESIQEYFKS